MHYYCIEHESCGFVKWESPPTNLDDEDLICPNCYSPLLKYESHITPQWLKETPPIDTQQDH